MTNETRPRRRGRYLLAGVVAAAVVVGGVGVGIANAAPSSAVARVAAPTTSGTTTAPTTSGSGTAAPETGSERPQRKPHLSGTVTKVSGDTITIKDRDGFTRVIETSTGETTFSDGLTMPVAVGTRIEASGEVNADGVRLNATELGKAPEAGQGGRGPGGRPWRGPGDPGGRPPTGTNQPAPPTGTNRPAPPTGAARPSAPSTASSTG